MLPRALLILFLLLPVTLSAADPVGRGMTERLVGAAFTAVEQQIITEYFSEQPLASIATAASASEERDGETGSGKKNKGKGGKSKGLPPGLARRDELPPGLQKQLEKNGTLPPGLAKRDLPSRLESRLPTRDSDQERVIVDNDVVLIEAATGVVLDILYDVVRGSD